MIPGGPSSAGANDDGRVLVLVLGAVVVLAMLVGVVVDAAHLYLSRRSLDAVTDAAALAGAQAVDLGAVYRDGAESDVPLDGREVREAVARHVSAAEAAGGLDGFAVTAVRVEGTEVTVETRTLVRLPLVGPVTRGRTAVVVRGAATARNRVLER